MSSNYPPGHPTGIGRGHETQVFHCEHCYMLITTDDSNALKLRLQLKHGKAPTCPTCNGPIQRAECEHCGDPATRIDEDRAVHYFAPYCCDHGMSF